MPAKNSHGRQIVLIPRPSGASNDPLNWSSGRKARQVCAIVFAGFASTLCPWANLLAIVVQSTTYGVTPVQMSYGSPAALAGLMIGPVLVNPFVPYLGRSFIIFWSLVALSCSQIWAALMTDPGHYYAFIMSRLVAGVAGSLPTVLGCSFIIDAFYLHQRGRLVALYDIVYFLGTAMALTVGGFLTDATDLAWTWTIWWTVPIACAAAIGVLLFCEESWYDRVNLVGPPVSSNWLKHRLITVFAGWKVASHSSSSGLLSKFCEPFIIGISPIAIIPGLYCMVAYGFSLLVGIFTAIYVQTPVSEGGYGYTPRENACLSFIAWAALLLAQISALLMDDRLPIYASLRFGEQKWQPEYRLLNMILPLVLAPTGLVLVGVALQYHLHIAVLAIGSLFLYFVSVTTVPNLITYVIDCHVDRPVEVAIAFGMWRLALGIALPFFAQPWAASVGAAWQFGTAAIIVSALAVALISMIFWGAKLRLSSVMRSFRWQSNSEDGEELTRPSSETRSV